MSPDTSTSLRSLSSRELEERYAGLHRQVFACYEDAQSCEQDDPDAYAKAMEQAQARAAPLIERARAVHEERVRRLRKRARTWWMLAYGTAVIGALLIAWLALRS